jgi:hypothetical protein
MREITKNMVKEFKIKQLGYDMMGYYQQKGDIITFHHLLVAHRNCKSKGLGEGYFRWNGAILYTTPHEYLHVIENRDYDMFSYITSEMLDENIKGYLDLYNIRRIHDVLEQFEKEHCADRTKRGKVLIKESYTRRKKV